MANLNIHYIAGFFDGEGCISGQMQGIRIIITNTNLQILKDINHYFGFGKITNKLRTSKDVYRKPCYQWICWSKDAEQFLKIIYPYLRQKKTQAKLALRFCDTYKYRRITRARRNIHGYPEVPGSILKIRKYLVKQLKEAKWI